MKTSDKPLKAFSGDGYLGKEIRRLVSKHGIQTIIETGTYLGDTTVAFASVVPKVHTIENSTQFAAIARQKFTDYPGITLHKGNSPNILRSIMPTLRSPTLYFLDAHWYNYWPLLDELHEIARNPKNVKVIVIHDFYVPETSLGYDAYVKPTAHIWLDHLRAICDFLIRPLFPALTEKLLNKQKLDWAYIKRHIQAIHPTYTYHYNTAAEGKKRGVIFIEF